METPKPVRLWSIDGNRQWLDGGAMFGNAPRAVWQNWMPPDEKGRIALSCRALLARIGNKTVLCEAGIGAFMEPKLAQRFGVEPCDRHLLLERLQAAGIDENAVDYVILSHLHFDHAGGLLPAYAEIQKGRDSLLFPRATYVVGAEALARAKAPHLRDRASFVPELTGKLETSGRLLVVSGEGDPALPAEISFRYSHGHTPGQMHTVIQGKDSSVVFCGDLIPGSHWVHLPITMGYDRFPEQLIEEKANLYESAVPHDWWLFFTHDPEFSAGQVARNEKGKVEAINTKRVLDGFAL